MKICSNCQKEFTGRSDKIYCTEKCRKKIEKKRKKIREAPARAIKYEAYLAANIPLWNAARAARMDKAIAAREARARRPRKPLPPGIRAEPVRIKDPSATIARLEAQSIPEPNSGCRLWLGPVWDDGYGRIMLDGRYRRVARVALAAYKGPVLRGVLVLHTCDQPTCVEPSHLYAGTAKNNHDDMVKRGRKAPLPNTRGLKWSKRT